MNSNSTGGPINEVRKIVKEEGLRAFWKGVGPAMARAGALTASQLATYDESKQVAPFYLLFNFFPALIESLTSILA